MSKHTRLFPRGTQGMGVPLELFAHVTPSQAPKLSPSVFSLLSLRALKSRLSPCHSGSSCSISALLWLLHTRSLHFGQGIFQFHTSTRFSFAEMSWFPGVPLYGFFSWDYVSHDSVRSPLCGCLKICSSLRCSFHPCSAGDQSGIFHEDK